MEGARVMGVNGRRRGGERPGQQAAEEAEKYRVTAHGKSPAELLKEIDQLEDEMYKAAADLDFEKAARLRDDISQLKEAAIRLG